MGPLFPLLNLFYYVLLIQCNERVKSKHSFVFNSDLTRATCT